MVKKKITLKNLKSIGAWKQLTRKQQALYALLSNCATTNGR